MTFEICSYLFQVYTQWWLQGPQHMREASSPAGSADPAAPARKWRAPNASLISSTTRKGCRWNTAVNPRGYAQENVALSIVAIVYVAGSAFAPQLQRSQRQATPCHELCIVHFATPCDELSVALSIALLQQHVVALSIALFIVCVARSIVRVARSIVHWRQRASTTIFWSHCLFFGAVSLESLGPRCMYMCHTYTHS